MIAVAPHHLIYTYLISIRLLDIVKIGVGCYCFIHAKAMREAREKDKADIVPTPYFLSAFFGEFGKHNNFIMKKVLILICAFCMSVTEPTIALTREILIAENMQQGNWEELGKVSLKFHKEGGNYMGMFSEGILYVRVIGERAFYRVKIETMYEVKFYSVAVGEYVVEGKKYNAKVAEDYYFNI